MSANRGELKQGKSVFHNNVKKTVRDWFFIGDPDGCPNSDIIVINFTDGTNTKDEGFTNIEYLREHNNRIKRENKALKTLICNMDLSLKSFFFLNKIGIKNVEELLSFGLEKLSKKRIGTKTIGKKQLADINYCLKEINLSLN